MQFTLFIFALVSAQVFAQISQADFDLAYNDWVKTYGIEENSNTRANFETNLNEMYRNELPFERESGHLLFWPFWIYL